MRREDVLKLLHHLVGIIVVLQFDFHRGDRPFSCLRVDHASHFLKVLQVAEHQVGVVFAHSAFVDVDDGREEVARLRRAARADRADFHIVTRFHEPLDEHLVGLAVDSRDLDKLRSDVKPAWQRRIDVRPGLLDHQSFQVRCLISFKRVAGLSDVSAVFHGGCRNNLRLLGGTNLREWQRHIQSTRALRCDTVRGGNCRRFLEFRFRSGGLRLEGRRFRHQRLGSLTSRPVREVASLILFPLGSPGKSLLGELPAGSLAFFSERLARDYPVFANRLKAVEIGDQRSNLRLVLRFNSDKRDRARDPLTTTSEMHEAENLDGHTDRLDLIAGRLHGELPMELGIGLTIEAVGFNNDVSENAVDPLAHLIREAGHDTVDHDHRGHAEHHADNAGQSDIAGPQITDAKQ